MGGTHEPARWKKRVVLLNLNYEGVEETDETRFHLSWILLLLELIMCYLIR